MVESSVLSTAATLYVIYWKRVPAFYGLICSHGKRLWVKWLNILYCLLEPSLFWITFKGKCFIPEMSIFMTLKDCLANAIHHWNRKGDLWNCAICCSIIFKYSEIPIKNIRYLKAPALMRLWLVSKHSYHIAVSRDLRMFKHVRCFSRLAKVGHIGWNRNREQEEKSIDDAMSPLGRVVVLKMKRLWYLSCNIIHVLK